MHMHIASASGSVPVCRHSLTPTDTQRGSTTDHQPLLLLLLLLLLRAAGDGDGDGGQGQGQGPGRE